MTLEHSRERTQELVLDYFLELWREGFLTSFGDHNIVNYDGEIREFWDRQFSTLNRNARIVDLATGNGPVALLAAEYSAKHRKHFRIDALDKVPIDPERDIPKQYHVRKWLKDIRFQGNVPNENTGLESQCADLVTSSYGFEYGDLDASANEAARLLKPGGHIAIIAHHASSVTANEARENLEQIRLLDKERMLFLAGKVVDSMGFCASMRGMIRNIFPAKERFAETRSGTETPHKRKYSPAAGRILRLRTGAHADALNKLDNAISRALDQAERLTNPQGILYMNMGLNNVLKPRITRAKRRKIIRELQDGCDKDRRSIESLLSVVLDSKGFARLLSHLESAGLAVCESFPLVVSKPALQRDQLQTLTLEEQLPSRFVYWFRPMNQREYRIFASLNNANAPLPGESGDTLIGWAIVARKT